MKVCVVGLGRAGLPLAAVMADAGLEVLGYDIDPEKVSAINSGQNPLPEEPGLQELIEKHSGLNLKATNDLDKIRDCYAYVVVVPLFLDAENKPDFSVITHAFKIVGSVIEPGDLVILETTVPPKTTETLVKKIVEDESGYAAGTDFYLAYSPERIMTGHSISRFTEFPKVVGGINDESTNRAFELYKKFSNPIRVKNCKTAELVKIAEGVYRDVNIALANELYKVTEDLDVDFWEMRQAAHHDFSNIHKPGLVGGHCIPVYPWFLINDFEVPLIKASRCLNEDMVDYYVKKVLGVSENGKVGIIGLTYRPGVNDINFTRTHELISKLKAAGFSVYAADPMFEEEIIKTSFNAQPLSDLDEMDVIVLMHPVAGFDKKLEKHAEKIIDVKNSLKK